MSQPQYKLKSWIDPKYIIKNSLASNPCSGALKIIFDDCETAVYDLIWYTRYESITSNNNCEFVEILLQEMKYYNISKFKFESLACNSSLEVINFCINNILPDYENEVNFRDQSKIFLRNLCENRFAAQSLLDYVIDNSNSKLVISGEINVERILILYGNKYKSFSKLSSRVIEFIKNKILEDSVKINNISNVRDDFIVDIIIKNIDKIDFSGSIGYNENPRLEELLNSNIERVDMYKLCLNNSNFAVELIRKNLSKVGYFEWMTAMNFNNNPMIVEVLKPLNYNITDRCLLYHRILQRCDKVEEFIDKFKWENCTDIKFIEENLDRIKDKSILPWYFISTLPEIFEEVKGEKYDMLSHYNSIKSLKPLYTPKW